MSGTQAIEAPRGVTTFKIRPEDITVITDEKHELFDERVYEPANAELAHSLDAHGNENPVILWKDGNRLVLVAGRRRVKAALLVREWRHKNGEPEFFLKAFVKSGTVHEMQRIMFSENAHRKDLEPLQRAKQMHRALTRFGWNVDELAAAFACSTATVKTNLKLIDADTVVQEAVENKDISAATASKLTDLPREKQKETLATMKKEGMTKGVKAERAVEAAKNGKPMPTKNGIKKMRSRKQLEDCLEKINVLRRTKGGTYYEAFGQGLEFCLGALKRVSLHPKFAAALRDVVKE